MPIKSIQETKTNKSAGWSIQGGRTYSLEVRVVTDDPTIGPRAALLALNVNVGDTYRFPLANPTERDYGACLHAIQARTEADDNLSYLVTLDYGPFDPIEQAGAQQGDKTWVVDPTKAPPKVEWGAESTEKACLLDRNGTPILNAAGDPFDPPLMRPEKVLIATVTRTLTAFDPNWILEFKDKVNKNEWMGYPPGAVLCKDVSASPEYDTDHGWLWPQKLVFGFKPIVITETPDPNAPWKTDTNVISAGWAEQVLNAGLRQRNAAGNGVEQILIDGAPTTSPVCLTKNGNYDPTADPNYLTFDVYEEADFDLFDLPDDLFTRSGGGPADGVPTP